MNESENSYAEIYCTQCKHHGTLGAFAFELYSGPLIWCRLNNENFFCDGTHYCPAFVSEGEKNV